MRTHTSENRRARSIENAQALALYPDCFARGHAMRSQSVRDSLAGRSSSMTRSKD